MAKYEMHDFYCLQCGRQGIPVMRKIGKQHRAFHRKKLYCPHCQVELNHMEIRSQEEKERFMEAFRNGEYENEATKSISYVRACRDWQIDPRA